MYITEQTLSTAALEKVLAAKIFGFDTVQHTDIAHKLHGCHRCMIVMKCERFHLLGGLILGGGKLGLKYGRSHKNGIFGNPCWI